MFGKREIYPVSFEIPADMETPVSTYLALDMDGKESFLLESVEKGESLGRYSFIGIEPELEFVAKKNNVKVKFKGKEENFESSNPLKELKEIINSFKVVETENEFIPLTAGLVGYFSYDSIRYFEKIPDIKPDRLNLPDIYLLLPKILIVFDHIKQRVIINSHYYDIEEKNEVFEQIKNYERKIYNLKYISHITDSQKTSITLTSNFRKENFLKSVEKVKEYIVAGDIFQGVISQRFMAFTEKQPFDIYRKLRMINPSPYMFYIDFSNFKLIGSSPEVMVKKIKNGETSEILVRPIAGTRPRGRDTKEDLEIEKELLSDKKELAEHTMLLDLARNDVGRISKYNTVRVEKPFHIERYSHVMHIVSDVYGEPRDDVDPIDIIGATFPAGTVTGAPKIRAMEIIEEIEPEKRGIYAGCVGYIDFRGNFDSCITIRTIIYKNKQVYLQAGAGIVYDSIPEREYQECINKAKALMKAIL